MSPGVSVTRCRECGWQGFPERIWCPACGSDRVSTEVVHDAQIVAAMVLRRAVGGIRAPVSIGLVALAGGGELVARLQSGVGAGTPVRLATDLGAPVAQAERVRDDS